jgi:hypothetical protein
MKNPVFVFAVFMLLTAVSCNKKTNTTTTPVNPNPVSFSTYVSMNAVFNLLNTQSKTVTINADSGGSFYGTSGTRYIIKKSSFQSAGGVNITGNVQITVSEIMKKGDMIFNEVLPVSNGNPIFSGGEISIAAGQSSQQIFLKPSTTFQANIPQTLFDSVSTYFSGRPSGGSAYNNINWGVDAPVSPGYIVNKIDTIQLFSDSMQWCNAGRFISFPQYQSFKVTVNAAGNTVDASSSLIAYVMYDNHKGVWPMTSLNGNVFSENHVPNMPVHFVAMALLNGHFYAGASAASVTPATNGNYTLTLTEVDPYAFKGQLNGLYP